MAHSLRRGAKARRGQRRRQYRVSPGVVPQVQETTPGPGARWRGGDNMPSSTHFRRSMQPCEPMRDAMQTLLKTCSFCRAWCL